MEIHEKIVKAKDERIRELEAKLAVSQMKLTDQTKVGNTTWSQLKEQAM